MAEKELVGGDRPPSQESANTANAKSFWVKEEKEDSDEESEEMDFPEKELKW